MSISVQSNGYCTNRNGQYRNTNKSASGETTFPLSAQQESKEIIVDPKKPEVIRNSIDSLGPNAPDSVRDAWDKAEKETGANGNGQRADGFRTHISAMLSLQLVQLIRTGHSDFLGDSVESARDAAQRALDMMTSSLWVQSSSPVGELHQTEKSFYRAFLKNLDAIK